MVKVLLKLFVMSFEHRLLDLVTVIFDGVHFIDALLLFLFLLHLYEFFLEIKENTMGFSFDFHFFLFWLLNDDLLRLITWRNHGVAVNKH